MTSGELVHLELHTDDVERAQDFYRSLLGWRVRARSVGGPAYRSLDIGLSAGMVGCGATPAVWIPYVEVDDLAAATRCAVAHGAELTLAPRSGPGGRRSVVRSLVLGNLALWEPA